MDKKLKLVIIGVITLVVILLIVLIDSLFSTKEVYNVTFEDKGNIIATKQVESGNKVDRPTDPVLEGYDFLYWTLNNEEFDFNTKITKDITLVSKYNNQETFTVTFISDDEIVNTVTVKDKNKVDFFNIARNGYIFLYWSLNDEKFDFDTPITSDITLVAQWKQITEDTIFYTVVFDDGSKQTNINVLENDKVNKINNPTSSSHDFLYWELDGQEFDFNTTITSNIYLAAKWTEKEFTVNFDSNGGTSVESQLVKYNNKITSVETTKDDFVFLYWSLDGNPFDTNTPITKDITLIAEWGDETLFNVAFDSNGGTHVDSVNVKDDQLIDEPVCTKEGYVLLGWKIKGTDEYFDFDNLITGNMILIAVWEEGEYLVSFNTDGGTSLEYQLVKYPNTVLVPQKPTKEGYEFLYWAFEGEQYLFNEPVTKEISLLAIWTQVTSDTVYHTVSFNSAGGTSVDSIQVVHGGIVEIPETTRENYHFVSWQYGNYDFDFNTKITSNITLSAKWKIYSFIVEFDTNGGSFIAPVEVNMFGKVSYVLPSKIGYNFISWQLDGKDYNFNTLITEDITLVATWEVIIYHEVTFDSNGGSSVSKQQVEENKIVSIPYPPLKANYTFAYWMYNDVQFDFNTVITEDITLVAYWISTKENLISFDTGGGSYVHTQIIISNELIQFPETPQRENYLFVYWELDGQEFDFNTPIFEGMTLTARWIYHPPQVLCNVTFISNDKVYRTENVIQGNRATTFTVSATSTHRFSHWTYSDGSVFSFEDTITKDITLYDNWDEIIYYTITYELDGGYFPNSNYVSFKVEHGNKVPTITSSYIPKKTLATFSHWELANGDVYALNTHAVTGNLTLYAKYNEVEINVSLSDVTYVFYGGNRGLYITGSLPTGVTVRYENNIQSQVGSYTVYAHLVLDNEVFRTLTATLTITPINLTPIIGAETLYEYTGSEIEHSVLITATGWGSSDTTTASRGSFIYTINKPLVSVGTYTATLRLVKTVNGEYIDNANYILAFTTFEIQVIASRQYNFEYKEIDGGIEITGFFNSLQTELNVPSYINSKPVLSISERAFENYTSLQTVILPSTLKVINNYAFNNCYNLESVVAPGLEEIGSYAFNECKKLTSVNMGNKVRTIQSRAFFGCVALVSIDLSDSLETIGSTAFQSCTSLQTVDFGTSLITIEASAFYNCNKLTSITLPTTLRTIGNSAFQSCSSLTSVSLPEGLLTLGSNVFYYNRALTTIKLPDTITSIGNGAFDECNKLQSANIPRDLETIPHEMFLDCTVLSTVTFHNNSILKSINYNAFRNTALTSINLPNTLQYIGNYAFYNVDELTTVSIPDSVTSMGSSVFYSCDGITSYKLSAQMTKIPDYLFRSSTKLTEIIIPSQITEIGVGAFYDCTNVTSIKIQTSKLEKLGNECFRNLNKMTSFVIPIAVKEIGTYVFYNWTSLTTMQIPANVTKIDSYAFQNCTSLTTFIVPNNVTTLGAGVFSGCTSLKTVNIQSAITTLPASTFSGCTSLTSAVLPVGITTIGNTAFYNCTSLKSFTIPSTVTQIQYAAFKGCTGLSSIIIPSTVTSITQSTYYASTNGAFSYTPDLVIYVSWAQDEKPGGWAYYWQTGCTISYNFKG